MIEIDEYTIKPGWIGTGRLAELTGMRPSSIRLLARQGRFNFEMATPRLMLIEIASFLEYDRRLDELASIGRLRGAPRGPRKVRKSKRGK